MKNILSNFKFLFVGLLVMAASMFMSGSADAETSVSVNTAAAPVLLSMIDGKLIKDFAESHGWMSTIKSHNKYVNNDAINLIKIGAEPDVLIDNTTYPIPVQTTPDEGLTVSLKKWNTKVTEVTDDELDAIAYNKESEDRAKHVRAIEKKKARFGLHSIAPAGDTVNTPVIFASGASLAGSGTRERITTKDIIELKARFDKSGVPLDGRHLVLCSEHVNDLLIEDITFQNRYQDTKEGQIAKNFYSFTIWQDVYNVRYTEAGAKVPFEQAAAGTDRVASIAYYAPKAWQATGSTKSYYRSAAQNPDYQKSGFNIRVYHRLAPLEWVGFGALVSKNES